MPASGSIQFALFGGLDLEHNIRVDEVYGFDLRRFNDIVAQKQYISRTDLQPELLSEDAGGFFFDFARSESFSAEEQKKIEVPVRQAGQLIVLGLVGQLLFLHQAACRIAHHQRIQSLPRQLRLR
jgi:protein arginine N-methyltransferase 7